MKKVLKFLFLLCFFGPVTLLGQPSEFTLSNCAGPISGRMSSYAKLVDNPDPTPDVFAEPGDYIAAFDLRGNCVGVAAILDVNGSYLLNIYGQNNVPGIGMANGETFELVIYDASVPTFYHTGSPIAGWMPIVGGGNIPAFLLQTFLLDQVYVPFPVELSRFIGLKLENEIKLEWTTESEVNNSHFEVEHSLNGHNFEMIGKIQGSGNSQSTIEYSFIDESPNIGLNYYRLKQVDFDGQFEYSKVITVNFDRKNSDDLEVFPNPTSAFADILLPESLTDRETVITLHDFAGREVLRRKEQPSNSVRLELEGLPAGYYTINVRSGNETFIKPLVIQ